MPEKEILESGFIEESGDVYLEESGDVYLEESGSVENINPQTFPVASLDEKQLREIVDNESMDLANNIIASGDSKTLTSYLEEFNLNMSKKNLLKILKMNELWDKVSDEALDRIENHSDELTNGEIINFIKVAQEAVINLKKGPEYMDTATPITLNQQNNTVNVNVNSDNPRIDRRSKEKIMEAVSKLLNISLDSISEETVIDEPDKENK